MPKTDWTFLESYCDGIGPHSGPEEVRVYPLGEGGNLILCQHCFAAENVYNYNRALVMRSTGVEDSRPQVEWNTAEVYAKGRV